MLLIVDIGQSLRVVLDLHGIEGCRRAVTVGESGGRKLSRLHDEAKRIKKVLRGMMLLEARKKSRQA